MARLARLARLSLRAPCPAYAPAGPQPCAVWVCWLHCQVNLPSPPLLRCPVNPTKETEHDEVQTAWYDIQFCQPPSLLNINNAGYFVLPLPACGRLWAVRQFGPSAVSIAYKAVKTFRCFVVDRNAVRNFKKFLIFLTVCVTREGTLKVICRLSS